MSISKGILITHHSSLITFFAGWLLSLAVVVQAATVNRIVAIVNDEVVTEADVLLQASTLLQGRHEMEPATDAQTMEMQMVVLRRLIEQRLILQEAKREGIVVPTNEILARLTTLRNQFTSDEEFEMSLRESHLSREQLKEQLREQLMVKKLIEQKVHASIRVSPQEVAQELSRHPELATQGTRARISHILVRVTEQRSEEQAKAQIEELAQQLAAGADFASLAKQHSEDPHAPHGGAMDWVTQGEFMPELDEAAFSLNIGEVSAPIQTRLGFHLLRVEARNAGEQLSMTEVNQTVYQRLYQQKFQNAFQRWLNDLRRKAYIEILAGGG